MSEHQAAGAPARSPAAFEKDGFSLKPRATLPLDPVAEIDAWRTERLAAHEEYLPTYHDRHLIDGQREQYAAVIDAKRNW